MSFLVIGNSPLTYGLAGGWDIFGKQAKEKRKLKLGLQAQSFSEKMTLNRYEQEKAAVETFRAKISAKLTAVEQIAAEAAEMIEQVRRVAEDPILEGDPVLEEIDKQLADFEEGLVQIQSGTVVDTAPFDTHRLAISYSDAQSALIAMTSLKTRTVGMLEDLRQKIQQVQAEKVRLEELREQRIILAEQERKRQEALQRELEMRRSDEKIARDRAEQEQIMSGIRKVNSEIQKERRAVANVKRKIQRVLQLREDRAQREADSAAKRAEIASMRAGMRSSRVA